MNWWEHVTKIVKKAGKRLYMLRLLKRANAEYLSDDIERVQKRALRIILPELCYADAREFINIPLLKERRESLCERFFLKHENLQTINELLPNKSAATYDFRTKCKYNNYFCKTERFRKSFLPQIISKLNCN